MKAIAIALLFLLFASVQCDVILNGALIPGGPRRKPMPTHSTLPRSSPFSNEDANIQGSYLRALAAEEHAKPRQLQGIINNLVNQMRPGSNLNQNGNSYGNSYGNQQGLIGGFGNGGMIQNAVAQAQNVVSGVAEVTANVVETILPNGSGGVVGNLMDTVGLGGNSYRNNNGGILGLGQNRDTVLGRLTGNSNGGLFG